MGAAPIYSLRQFASIPALSLRLNCSDKSLKRSTPQTHELSLKKHFRIAGRL